MKLYRALVTKRFKFVMALEANNINTLLDMLKAQLEGEDFDNIEINEEA